MSVDLWIDRVAAHAKVIVIRLLGGLDWWKYGIERLSALARERGIALAVLPGEDRDDGRLAAASTLPPQDLAALLRLFPRRRPRKSSRAAAAARGPCRHRNRGTPRRNPCRGSPAICLAKAPSISTVWLRRWRSTGPRGRWCRSCSTAPCCSQRIPRRSTHLCAALAARGLAPAPLVVTSLKDPDAAAFLKDAFARLDPAVIVTMTAFAAGNGDEPTALDAADVPVLQVVSATTRRAAWRESARGLGAADLAMHIVLPELDGRMLAGAVAFKDPLPAQEGLAFTALASRPEADRSRWSAERIAALVRLQALPRGERRIAVLMPDYPGAPGRTGYAVGLDVPASVLALTRDLGAAGYGTQRRAEHAARTARRSCRRRA